MIDVGGVTVDFGQGPVLDGLNFHTDGDEIVAIMGSSGGGKSTLLRCIAGLLRPNEGTVKVLDSTYPGGITEARKSMGMVFQSSALFDYMTVRQNISFALTRQQRRVRHDEAEAMVDEALEMVGLEADDAAKSPAELSGGMRKRVGIARAIVLRPRVLLYDEPTTGLDPVTTVLIDSLIKRLGNETVKASIFVSHDVASCCRTADRICFLSAGRFIFDGTPAAFMKCQEPEVRKIIEAAVVPALA